MSIIAEESQVSEKAEHSCGCGRHGKEESASYCATEPGQWVRVVREFVKLLKFGEVHLTVHKGRVVEIRKIEKVRFDER
jgi:hypothetical protein